MRLYLLFCLKKKKNLEIVFISINLFRLFKLVIYIYIFKKKKKKKMPPKS